jgi:hypothetical protein
LQYGSAPSPWFPGQNLRCWHSTISVIQNFIFHFLHRYKVFCITRNSGVSASKILARKSRGGCTAILQNQSWIGGFQSTGTLVKDKVYVNNYSLWEQRK